MSRTIHGAAHPGTGNLADRIASQELASRSIEFGSDIETKRLASWLSRLEMARGVNQ